MKFVMQNLHESLFSNLISMLSTDSYTPSQSCPDGRYYERNAMTMVKLFLGAFFLVLTTSIVTAPVAIANEANARKLAERAFIGKHVDAFRQLPNLPFYEIWIDRTLVYTDLDAKVLILGNLLDGTTLTNLREARLGELTALPFKDLPLEHAIKTVHGNGKHKLAVFADPNCGFCKKFEAELKMLDDVTIYTVLYPVLSPDSREKARAILCSAKPEQAWREWMDKAQMPPSPADSCQPPLDQSVAFGKKNDIAVTPTTFLENGRRFAGIMPIATLKSAIAAVKH